jgi:hypothetical protein
LEAERVARLLMGDRDQPEEMYGVEWTPRKEAATEGRSTLTILFTFTGSQEHVANGLFGKVARLSGRETGMEYVRDAYVD